MERCFKRFLQEKWDKYIISWIINNFKNKSVVSPFLEKVPINSNSQQESDERSKYFWGQNELKAFHWSLICLSAISEKKIIQFNVEDWKNLSEIFRFKQLIVLEYEAAKLLHLKDKKSPGWNQQEQKMLVQIIKELSDQNKWNEVARKLYQISEKKYFRTGKQCRQKWFNHLDPSKKHGSWTPQQDLKLLQLVQTDGRKWAKIVKSFNNQRTQHMIKNRFKSILMKQKKMTPQIKKEEKLITVLKQRLRNNNNEENKEKIEEIQSEFQQQENQDKFQDFQAQDKTVKSPSNLSENNHSSKHTSKHKSSKQEEKSINQEKKNEVIDNTINNYFQQLSETNKNQTYNGFKMYSPYCLAYMGANLTPTGLTPTYFSPPAFFMNNFSQSVMSFQHYLNNNNNQNTNQTNVGGGSCTNIKNQ